MPAKARDEGGQHVVLLHGIARTRRSMAFIERRLTLDGFTVHNLDYPSRGASLAELAESISDDVGARTVRATRLHFVGYSMGGLLTRAVVRRLRPPMLGRMVQVAPPNKGSEVADFWMRFRFYHRLYGPAGKELGVRRRDLDELLGPVDFELGVIAGNRSFDPFSSWLLIPGPDDGKVSVEATKVEGMAGHIVVPATHTFMPSNPVVVRQIAHFLKTGRFSAEA